MAGKTIMVGVDKSAKKLWTLPLSTFQNNKAYDTNTKLDKEQFSCADCTGGGPPEQYFYTHGQGQGERGEVKPAALVLMKEDATRRGPGLK
ncbi:hypothetical protein WJX81_003763 [Elliptochloris bilobata]|uniref:Uncharacterized protein n=1 Tax=Elliptochloris bilobata TaxID=381761 RepID=A0AAW1SD08_9CHLO